LDKILKASLILLHDVDFLVFFSSEIFI